MDETLARWLETGPDAAGPGTIADVEHIRTLLIAAARQRRPLSYSELLGQLGHRFTRPKMRALCRTLDAIDAAAARDGRPALAVLVVRESDRLPGQGWWVSRAAANGYAGCWDGTEAAGLVAHLQARAFDYWATAACPPPPARR